MSDNPLEMPEVEKALSEFSLLDVDGIIEKMQERISQAEKGDNIDDLVSELTQIAIDDIDGREPHLAEFLEAIQDFNIDDQTRLMTAAEVMAVTAQRLILEKHDIPEILLRYFVGTLERFWESGSALDLLEDIIRDRRS